MPLRILLSGTIAIDNIVTPSERMDGVLGGSAAFAAAAAKLFSEHVDVLSVVGTDFPDHYRRRLEGNGVDLSRVTVREGESFTWTGEYFDNMNHRRTIYRSSEVMTEWRVDVPEEWRDHSVVVACCMVPARQLELIGQCRNAKLVLSDSMDKYVCEPGLLDGVIARSHICTMNETEAKIYANSESIIEAGEYLLAKGARYAVIKQGGEGSTLFGRSSGGGLESFHCPAWPLRRLVDPTGAGDSFLGAIGGYLAAAEIVEPCFFDMKEALIRATVAASFTCESFSADALFEMTRESFASRLGEFRKMLSGDSV